MGRGGKEQLPESLEQLRVIANPEIGRKKREREQYNDHEINNVIGAFQERRAEHKGHSVWWQLEDGTKCQMQLQQDYYRRVRKPALKEEAWILRKRDWIRIGRMWCWRDEEGDWLSRIDVRTEFRRKGVADGLLTIMDSALTGIGRRENRAVVRVITVRGTTPESRVSVRKLGASHGYVPIGWETGRVLHTAREKRRARSFIKVLYWPHGLRAKKAKLVELLESAP